MGDRLAGRRVLITGGGTGIGAGIARRLLQEGARVMISGRREAPLVDMATQTGCEYVVGDVATADGPKAMVAAAVDRLGGLDIVVNNAGVARFQPLEDTDDALLDLHLDINVKGPFRVVRAAREHLVAAGGNILNIASTLAVRGLPGAGIYGASKGAVVSMTQQFAAELAPAGVRVNCICPAVVETPIFDTMMPPEAVPQALADMVGIHPLGRIGQPSDIAGAAAFLVSDDASWVTGAVLMVDGGVTAV